jgi:hypothetical protein
MLIDFRVTNFRSFRDEQTFSMVASADETLGENAIRDSRFSILKSAALYGANASGKSNFIKALGFMGRFVGASATRMNQGDPIKGIVPFRLDIEHRLKPTSFEIVVSIANKLYQYGFSATEERVHDEWLFVTPPGGRNQKWIERTYDAATEESTLKCRGDIRKNESLLKERTRDNGLVLSRGAELNVAPLSELFLWFRKSLITWDSSGEVQAQTFQTMEAINEDPLLKERVVRLLRDADLGIVDIYVERQERSILDDGFPSSLKKGMDALRSGVAEGKYGYMGTEAKTLHTMNDSEQIERFDLLTDESNGTIHFFALAGLIINALDNGSVIVIDEIDCSMHPLLTKKLIRLFQQPEVNKTGAQLLFTTHDSSLMDRTLLRRDQIWIAEKNNASATTLCSLYDFEERPRNTEAFERNYLTGRYGGVPRFGATFEDLTLQ